MRGLKVALTLALGLGAVGCGDAGPVGVALGGNGSVVVTVSSGTTPNYAWTGGNALRFSVTTSSGGAVWDLEALSTSAGFAPPVTHGVVPNTARETTRSTPLVTGTNYTAHVTLLDGTTGTRPFKP